MDESTLNDLLECSVCLERLDTSSKVLPCQHTFCRKCLEVIVSSRQELRCPECRVLVEIKIDDLPPNVLLMRILEGMKNAAAQNNSNKSPPNANHNSGLHNTLTTLISTQEQNNLNCRDNTKVLSHENHHQQQVKNRASQDQIRFASNQAEQLTAFQPNIVPQNAGASVNNIVTRRVAPHAFALYDFTSKEASDLSFKKGDVILLKRKLDVNWFIGELNGREGAFPSNYVQIIVSLPVPQCIALYDFKMGPNEEEGCLSFKKGAIINVLRRVDDNWAEGRLGACIGIFPIAFVEMNSLAKQLLDRPNNGIIPNEHSVQPSPQPRNLPPIPTDNNINPSDSTTTTTGSTSTTTSPKSTCSSNSNSISVPSSPISSSTSPQNQPNVKFRDSKEKRHSLNVITPRSNLSVVQSNRHSAEILSVPDANTQCSVITTATTANQTPTSRSHHEKSSSKDQATRVLKTSGQQNVPPSLPWGYLALYPYKPRKADELELKKGCVYIVTERCLDGWFKGKNWQDKSGVFPGNYVTPLRSRDQQQLMHQRKFSQSSIQTQQPTSTSGSIPGSSSVHQPPELPPRSNQGPMTSIWSNHVESFFTRKPSTNGGQNQQTPQGQQINTAKSSNKDQRDKPPAGHHSAKDKERKDSSNSASSSAVNLMKRLTNIKRSKSPVSNQPAANAYSMDNPSFEDTTPTRVVVSAQSSQGPSHYNKHNNMSHPVHVRSGSCPSQLLQNLPTELVGATALTTDHPVSYGSQRIKGHKERPALQGIRQQMEAATIAGNDGTPNQINNTCTPSNPQQQICMPLTTATHHRKSQSLDANTISAQMNSNSPVIKATLVHTRESRFRCVVSYPPNSDVELELNVGDIVYVHRKQKNGWYKGTHARTNKTGLFPASFVEPDV